MPTRFGGRQRPHFKITDWITFGGDSVLPAAAPAALLGSGNVQETLERLPLPLSRKRAT
jgi:hypothetical protein